MAAEDRYFWAPGGSTTLREFIKKNRPAVVNEDETPWIWVQGVKREKKDPEQDSSADTAAALGEAQKQLTKLQDRLHSIEHDDKIPVRAKKGDKNKKAHRDEAHKETTDILQAISVAHGCTTGKWLLFPRHADVNRTWATIAESVAEGPLREAGVYLAKVAPSSTGATEGYDPTHLICCYMENVCDERSVKKVLETLLRSHGLEPSACKSDLYTLAGIDSNHPTKLRSSLYRPSEMFTKDEIVAMKEEYNANKKDQAAKGHNGEGVKGDNNDNGESEDVEDEKGAKKKAAYIILESDSDTEQPIREGKRKAHADDSETPINKAKKAAPLKTAHAAASSAALRYAENDIFAGPEGDDDSD